MLTKGKFLAGIQCEKRLWLHKNISQVPQCSLSAEFMSQQGDAIEREAYKKFPNGKCATLENRDAELGHTEKLMADGEECLFQPSFSADGIRVRCDILRKRNGAWDIIEVKSSSLKKDEKKDKLKDEHIADLAVQWHVLKNADIPLGGAFLMLVNTSDECVFPDLSELMLETEVTDKVRDFSQGIPDLLRKFQATLGSSAAPDISIGEHCCHPFVSVPPSPPKAKNSVGDVIKIEKVERVTRDCPFKEHCWKDVPKASFDTIPGLRWPKKKGMIQRGVLLAADADVKIDKLTEPQQRYVDIVRSGSDKPDTDKDAIRAQLAELEFPLYFLDFETMGPAIPRFDGMRPYQQFPFQFSCHIMRKMGGEVEHHKYLHPNKKDPRLPLLSKLVDCVGRTGSIVVYHKSMEDGVLKRLANIADDDQAERLNGMRDRLWDLEEVFKKNYLHWKFLGQTSIKAVLPVLVPKVSYDGMEIQDGLSAPAYWDLMINGKKDYTKELLEYCHLDTEAMVLIYRHLLDELAR